MSKPKHGAGESGRAFDPKDLEEDDEPSPGTTRSAPAPGVPVSDEEYERMKEAAGKAPSSAEKKTHEVRPNRKER
ncbi:MAG: hypothetical protein QOK37_3137 [Thermoanaerobaculia bacterium]|nr:hypothetical protein [Thermoanaerobaculia bacterium]